MDFSFSKDEKMLQDSAREYMRDKIMPIAAEEDRKGPLPRKEALKYLKSLIPFGYIGPQIPTSRDGPGLTFVETGIIFHELGKAWASLGAMAMATANALAFVMEAKKCDIIEKFLGLLLNADAIGGISFTEAGAGTDLSAISATASRENDQYVINGTKTWVSNAAVLDMVILVVKMENDNSHGYILIEKAASPFTVRETPKMGLKGLSTAVLTFSDCHVPKENLLQFQEGKSVSIKPDVLPETHIIPMIATGIAEAALEAAVTYAKQRIQFGKALGGFQMIQKMIAQMAIGLDAAKLLCFRALKLQDEGKYGKKEMAMAAAFAKHTATDVASKAIQIYGAYGYSDEFPMERYYRDAQCLSVMESTSSFHQLRIAEDIMGICAIT